MPPRVLVMLGAGLAAALCGCGIPNPYSHREAASGAPAPKRQPATAPSTADGPPQPPPPQLASRVLVHTPEAALARFANLYGNWQASQLPARARQLAAAAVGQARAQALGLAGRARTLERYHVANTATVSAIAAGEGPERGRWAVVTNELTSGDGPYLGLPATSHVTWATVRREAGGYVITGWYPAS
jgi:hypothetical protein